MKNYFSIALVISSKTTAPESISDRVGLTPTETRLRGTPTKTGLLRRPEFDVHEWWVRDELELAPGDRVEDQQTSFVAGFLDKVSVASQRIRELAENESVKMILVYHMNRMPYVGLSSSQVEKIAALGASVDFDFYMVD